MKFATFALASLFLHAADAASRATVHRKKVEEKHRRRATTFGRNRPEEQHHDTTVSSSAVKTADFYPNSSYDDADDRSCDGYYVNLKVKTDANGEDTAVYLTSMDVDDDVAMFLLSAPMMSLEKDEDYGEFEYCLPQTSSACYHLDVMSKDGSGCESDDACVTMEVKDEDGNSIEFKYDDDWHSKVEIDEDFGKFDAAAFCWGENDDCGDDSRNDDNDSDKNDDCDDEAPLKIDDTDSCDEDDMIEVQMKLEVNDGVEDISIILKEDSDKIWDYGEGCLTEEDERYNWKTCVDETKCSKFKFYVKDGDFDGALILNVDGKTEIDDDDSLDFNNNDVMIVEIGDCDDGDRDDGDAPTSIDDTCGKDEIEVYLNLKTDKNGEKDTAVILKEGSKKIWEYKQGSFEDEKRYKWTACVDEDLCTTFKFFDQDGTFDGDITLQVDGTEVESGDDSLDFIDDASGTPGIKYEIGDC